jgi:hypothetical protein
MLFAQKGFDGASTNEILEAAKEISEDKGKTAYKRIIHSVMALKMHRSGKEVIEAYS